MDAIVEYRERMLSRYDEAVDEFCAACRAVKDPHVPLRPGEWSAHQIAVHTRDTDREVYGLRARRTLNEEDPVFPNFDGEAWMEAHYDPREELGKLLDGLKASVTEQVRLLRALSPEGWSRPSRHETLGAGFTTQTWVERNLAHIEEHLQTLKGLPRAIGP